MFQGMTNIHGGLPLSISILQDWEKLEFTIKLPSHLCINQIEVEQLMEHYNVGCDVELSSDE